MDLVRIGRPVALAVALAVALPVLATEDDENDRTCLPRRGPEAGSGPAMRLALLGMLSHTGDLARDLSVMMRAYVAPYVPGTTAGADGPARWLLEGTTHAHGGRHEAAEQQFGRCRTEAAQAREPIVEAACTNNLGAVAAARGRYPEARSWFDRAAQQYRAVSDSLPSEAEMQRRRAALEARVRARGEAAAAEMKAAGTPNLQAVRELQQRLQAEGRRDPDQALLQRERVLRAEAQMGAERVALNLGNLAFALGQWEESLGHLKQALAGYEGRLSCRPAALDDLLRLRERLPRKDEVTALVERYRRAAPAKAPAEPDGGNLGFLAIGGSPDAAATAPQARPVPVTAARREDDDRLQPKPMTDPLSATSEAALQDLLARAERAEREGRHDEARRSAGIVVLRAQAAGRAEIEVAAQARLMRLEAAAGRPAVAIFHGKRAANLLQELRTGAAALPRNARRSYLRERETTYAQLARLLMQAHRLVEAERVLQMLKEDEGRQFIEGTGRAAYTSLPETPPEAAHRAGIAQATQALRRSDQERAAVGADRTFAILLTHERAGIEQRRLRAATELRAWLDPAAKSGVAELEQALRATPLEYQQAVTALFADGGKRLVAILEALNEDAPRFRDTVATPQQLAALADSLRRVNELRTAAAPVLEALRRQPSAPAARMLDKQLDPSNAMRNPMETLLQPTAPRLDAQALQRTQAQSAGVQTATGLAMRAYLAATGGREDRQALASVESALKGASPEALDGFLAFVRSYGQQMQAAVSAGPQLQASLAAQAGVTQMTPEALAARLLELASRRKGGAVAPATPPVPAPAPGDTSLVTRVQAQLEAAVERARGTAGPSATVALGVAPRPRSAGEPPALAMAEAAGRLWRIDRARESLEDRSIQAQATAGNALESAPGSVPATADESGPALAALGVRAALVYYLQHDGGVDALLVGPQGRQVWQLPLPRAELDRLTRAFATALRDPGIDPRPAARALHDRVFAPLADALAAAQVQVVSLSLSGSLRFVPFAALHDGQGWLAERHAFAINPGGRLADALKPASGAWQMAAFGASQGGANLPPLQGVATELDMIVRQGSRGALPGRQWLDGAFTAQALRSALGSGSQVVHIASHFRFEPGDAAQSFLLLGDGQRLSLQELGGPAYRFDRTELVTLSACQTGVSSDDAFGQEVDGLAALLMAQGAPSVLASLWQVDDGSTAQLMGRMYGLHAQRAQRPVGRALALQQAQIAMIRGVGEPGVRDEGPAQRGAELVSVPGVARGSTPLRAAHPYHWAPFVLMGSWL